MRNDKHMDLEEFDKLLRQLEDESISQADRRSLLLKEAARIEYNTIGYCLQIIYPDYEFVPEPPSRFGAGFLGAVAAYTTARLLGKLVSK
jgi:hypothetical protein